MIFFFFFFNDTATTEIYPLSLHDALPISPARGAGDRPPRRPPGRRRRGHRLVRAPHPPGPAVLLAHLRSGAAPQPADRKSTRLNSSHANISYAVFCLKKKKKKNNR